MKVLVVDDMPVFREPIEACLRLAGFETFSAGDGEEALQVTRAHRPDVILLDLSMPRVDGITFLKRLRAEAPIANTRVILLTARSERQFVLAAATLGVRDYLLKSRFKLKDLLQRIGKSDAPPPASAAKEIATDTAPANKASAVAARGPATAPVKTKTEEVAPAMNREQFLARVQRAAGPRTLSGVVAQVITLAASPRGDTNQLAALIARDPMLSARVIQAANGAAYLSNGGTVTNIPDAIRKVGCNTIRNIAAALGVFDSLPDATADGFNPVRCWQHSFAVAQLSEKLSAVHAPESTGIAYVVGLCHDLGDIFLHTHFGKEYQQLHEARTRTGHSTEQLHREMFGMSYGQMVGTILKSIGLPELIREPIEAFHSRPRSRSADQTVKMLWIAENCANGAMIASSPAAEIVPLAESFCRSAVGESHPIPPDPQLLRSEVLSLTMTLANLSRADEGKVLSPMFERQETKVWLARAPGISQCDPISMALGELAQVEVFDHLPSTEEAASVDAIVAVAPSPDTRGFGEAEVHSASAPAQPSAPRKPVLALAADLPRSAQSNGTSRWRDAVALSELAGFIQQCRAAQMTRAAA